ncbi:MAG: tRNA (cytidine(34)-2'-O)-methyltransferase [Bacilli bacterium]
MINIVLYEPEIPENTGNIMRTCAATNSKLHLIEPLGFILDEKRIRRSGVNYIDKVDYQTYLDYDDFLSKNKGEFYYFTRYGKKTHSDIDFTDKDKNIYLIFGKESTGIPKEILSKNLDKCYRIPTSDNVRALNLSNCVALVTYEALRQQNYPNLLRSDPFKGEDYLEKE